MRRILFLITFTIRNGALLGGNVPIKVATNIAWGYFHYLNTKLILDRYPEGLAGVSYEQLMTTTILAVFGTLILNMFLDPGWKIFAKRIEDGTIDQDLLKPQSIYYTNLLYRIRLPPLGRLLVIIPALYVTVTVPLPYGDALHLLLALATFVIGLVGVILFQIVCHLLIFRWPHLTNITELTNYLNGLSRTPSTIFAQSVSEIALTFIPSIFMVSVPMSILYRGISLWAITVQIGGVLILMLLAKILYGQALRRHGSGG